MGFEPHFFLSVSRYMEIEKMTYGRQYLRED